MPFSAQMLRGAKWERFFAPATLRRGELHHSQGNVLSVVWDEANRILRAEVRDVRNAVYKVSLVLQPSKDTWRLYLTQCTCPGVIGCFHAAAALFAVAEGAAEDNAPAERRARLPDALRDWIQSFESAIHHAPPPPRNSTERILYLLNFDAADDRPNGPFVVRCVRCRVLRNGSNGKPANYPISGCRSPYPPAFVQKADVAIARLLYLATADRERYGQFGERLDGDHDDSVLRAIVETGRCHWLTADSQPLRLGTPRPATPIWRPGASGQLCASLAVTPPPTLILPSQPPWYLDSVTGECGPVETALAPAAAQSWIKAPPLDTIAAAQHQEVLAETFSRLSLPAPKLPEVAEKTNIPPVGILQIGLENLPWWEAPWSYQNTASGKSQVLLVTPSFTYADHRVTVEDSSPEIRHFDGTVLHVIRRNRPFEAQALRSLDAAGLVAAHSLYRAASNPRFRISWTLRESHDSALVAFVQNTLPELITQGWIIQRDPSFSLEVCEPSGFYFETALDDPKHSEDWFGVELGVSLGDEKINLLPVLLEGLRSNLESLQPDSLKKRGAEEKILIPLPDGRRVAFPAGRLREILGTLIELHAPDALNRAGKLRVHRLRAAQLGELSDNPNWSWAGADTLRALSERLRRLDQLPDATAPSGFGTTLRPYQSDGLRWLQFIREFGLGGVLADDMGLGKTIQALAHIVTEKEAGRLDRPFLVVSPTSVLVNWREEITRFAPNLKVVTLHGSDRHTRFAEIQGAEVVLTTYPLLPRDADTLLKADFHGVLLDEAQNIKNPRTLAAQVVCQLKSRHRLCLSGTPIENHLGELWSLFNFLIPGFLGDETRFRAVFRQPIEKANDEGRRKLLSRRIRPFLLRRRKDEVARELPTKTEIVRQVELTGGQRDLYETIRLAMEKRVRDEVKRKGVSRSHIIILDALLKLRQVCCDPSLVPLEAARRVTESAKLELLMEMLPTLLEDGRRILLFSQFTSMLALIEDRLHKAKIPSLLLTGDTTDRATPVRRFQAGEVPLFLISLKAGGSGLNLTAADTVILYDPWWNPAVEAQATDRAHRIGQEKPVFVYRLITTGTVEEKMAALQARKRELVQSLLEEGAGGPVQLQKEDLDLLFAPIG